ncbi:MAG TPA: DsbA family protein [Nitrosospira sp.]|nr:DsbA family protein [Nitrosospira sp.]
MNEKILWYVADPMCSWCWGFSPVVERIRQEYGVRLRMELLLGGLRAGTKTPMSPQQREEILHHWHAVQRATGQPFSFEGAMSEGFIYDTEPASRAIVTVSRISPDAVFPFFKAVQSAFYVDQQDVIRQEALERLAVLAGLDARLFSQVFESEAVKELTLAHFQKARRWGVHGFPTVIGQDDADYAVLTRGYCSFEDFRPRLDRWLEN